jgi:hypothetical protein
VHQIATSNAWCEPRVTTKWICDAFATARFSVLSWVGDHFQIPTVGIAVDPAHITLDDPALQALVRANQRALQTIVEQPRLAVNYIASFLGRLTSKEALQHYERYIGPHFTSDGRVDLNVAQHAVDEVATELGIPATAVAAATEMYLPACDRAATSAKTTTKT